MLRLAPKRLFCAFGMKKLFGQLSDYVRSLNKTVFLLVTLFTAGAVFVNYRFGLNGAIKNLAHWQQYGGWYLLFLLVFGFAYLVQAAIEKTTFFQHQRFVWLLLIAPALFAWKMAAQISFSFSPDVSLNAYWNAVVYWPLKVAVLTVALILVHRRFDEDRPFYGVTFAGFTVRPYLLMLLVMVPLVAAASTQDDFLRMYPRLQRMAFLSQSNTGWCKLLYELSYGIDFFSIELFFRGFLVLAFARWAGEGAILPMAVFYCTIHFGKPLGECISSYFGGLILGVVSYQSRSIMGGFFVHVGIAWLMELGGSFPLVLK